MPMTPEIAHEIGIVKNNKAIENMSMRNCPIYMDNAITSLLYFNETKFQYIKDIQVEAALIGFTTLRDSEHVSKYREIMDKVEYGNNPDVYITMEQRAKRDRFEFTGSLIKGNTNLRISTKTRNSLFALSQRINMDSNNIDIISYIIGYQRMFNDIDVNEMNRQNKELLLILTNEVKRIHKYLEMRAIKKIIDHCPIQIDYNTCNLKWSI